ncbi:hypothetical protein CgunFtcFv8_016355 [Champsocephalus gunnari]|uniref:ADF-H domain-containing protein n=1 Tax=Champsocephalus gunnari TaxID=52237 RepID=A0AAN8CTL6_CHAGU|nr:hypothetical protein CgunFtcFv8_016355 [Champsocephalus gunnari]
MASGVKVADEVKQIFNAMKVVKSDDDEKERIRIVVLHIDVEIKVEKIYRQKDLEDVEDVYKFVKNLMLADQCRYFLYDCHFETKEGIKKEELVFMMWAPGTSVLKGRMQYASSKSAIQKTTQGVKHVLEFAEKILLGEAIEFETSQKAVHERRLDIATSLLITSDDLSRLCFHCGMEKQDEEHWICCDICQRWYHHQCVQRPPVDQPYLCPGCT